jgi:hypothetical protein
MLGWVVAGGRRGLASHACHQNTMMSHLNRGPLHGRNLSCYVKEDELIHHLPATLTSCCYCF